MFNRTRKLEGKIDALDRRMTEQAKFFGQLTDYLKNNHEMLKELISHSEDNRQSADTLAMNEIESLSEQISQFHMEFKFAKDMIRTIKARTYFLKNFKPMPQEIAEPEIEREPVPQAPVYNQRVITDKNGNRRVISVKAARPFIKLTKIQGDQLEKDYLSGMTLASLANKYRITTVSVCRRIKNIRI